MIQSRKTETQSNIESILERHDVRVTPVRQLVLRFISNSSCPVSAQEIEDALETVDRSSITRTLSLFTEAHIIHQISDGSGSKRYELCLDAESERHKDEHAHFHCRKCGKTYCLPDAPVFFPAIPVGYKAESISVILTGFCSSCNEYD
ncbi:MAG: transcriptional repressor [Bacteroidales bacterium]|nr:transcriptional repressor [Bacteroidales bacterium]MBD5223727.1 transcriptional repressor [Bacteroidales bacterium]